jgi:RHS repeat-associated protein
MSRYKNNNTGAVNTSKGYNGAFLLSNKTDELGRTELFDYDENYNITKHTDKLGAATIYTYDNLDRMTSWENRVEKCVYSYDSRSLLVQSVYYPDKSNVNSGETTTYSYTQDSKLQTKTLPDGKSITYSYDVQGNIVNINDYLGQNIIYTYDENNQIHTVTWNGLTFTYYYYPDGMIKKISYPTQSIQMEYTYDGFNRLIGTGIRKNGQIVQAYYNAYDKNSNVTVTNDGHGSTYTYDAVDRLKTATGGIRGENTTYNYNQLGDITGINSNLNIYPDLAVGNYTWNDRDNLTSYTGSNGTYTYKYNGEGLRTSKYKNSVKVTEYYYDEGNRVINEVEGTDNISIVYGHMPLARVVNGNIYYYLYNSHGDVVKVLDYSGNQINTYNYDEWGVMLSKSEGIKNDLTYFGQIYDDESKNYYLSSRYYDPSTKRFLSRDTYEGKLESPMSLNSYAYCQNNPLKYVDVNGHFVDTAIDLVSVGLSTVSMIQDPSVSNFISLAWDIGAAALPFIPGSYVKKLGKLAGKVDDVVDLKNGKYLDDVIEGTSETVAKYWDDAVEFNGVKVYGRNDLIDPNLVDDLGRTNLQRMESGIAPIGPDGKSINLHHMTQMNDGAIAEVTQSFHQQNSKVIHINPNTVPSGIDRNAFGTWKKQYWKNRVNDFK